MKIRAKALLTLVIMEYNYGDYDAAHTAGNESIDLARRSGDKLILSLALAYMASGEAIARNGDESYALAQESLAIARKHGNKSALGFSLTMMGEVSAIAKRDYESAIAYGKEAIAILEEAGYRWGSSMTTLGLGVMARFLGDHDQARLRFKACLPAFLEIGDKHRVNMARSELAHIERDQGQYLRAIPMYRETILEWQRLGHRAAVAHQLECFALIAKAQEQAERAARLFGAAEALREKINIQMSSQERMEYDREVADLRANLDEKAFVSHWADGRALTMDQAIKFALEV